MSGAILADHDTYLLIGLGPHTLRRKRPVDAEMCALDRSFGGTVLMSLSSSATYPYVSVPIVQPDAGSELRP